ncbi:MAG: glycosyltransferase [Candidatus Hodarchaeota archaeon]
MKILVLSQMFPCKRHATSAIFFANLMKELAKKTEELIIITPRAYIPKILIRLNKKWVRWHIDPMISKKNGYTVIRPFILSLRGALFSGVNGVLMQYSLLNLFHHLIKTKGIQIVLGYNMLPEGFAVVQLAKMFRLPVGFWAIGSDVNDLANHNRINYYLSKKSINKSDLIITESKDLENRIRTFFKESVHTNPIKTFYKGIDVSNFQNLPPKNDLLKELKLNAEKKYILFVGRFIREKGVYELIQAFSIIAKKYPEIDLIFIGEQPEKVNISEYLKDDNIIKRIHFKGIISHREVAYFMKVSELLVHPSWAEGLPNVVMEAMACGLPVVTTHVGGIPEVLINRITGLSVPLKNVEKLVNAMDEMIDDHNLRQTCINNAKELIINKFDVKKNASLLYQILQERINVSRE